MPRCPPTVEQRSSTPCPRWRQPSKSSTGPAVPLTDGLGFNQPNRYLSAQDLDTNQLVHAVWELTLACNLKCLHCGSRAGNKRPDELTTEECLDVVDQLRAAGVREVTLIGGEAYMRTDWVQIVRAISEAGMQCTLQTGAWQLTDARIRMAADAGLVACGISVDGLSALHDHLRGRAGSFDVAIDALRRVGKHGIKTSVNTQITAAVLPDLRELLKVLVAVEVKNWQVQLTVAMGRAADNHDLLLQPYQMNELMPLLAELYVEGLAAGVVLQPGNNIGYFGPYESMLRGSGDSRVSWSGCLAGRNGLGIEADGTIKGCPSLPTTSYSGGNVRDTPLAELWATAPELSFTRRDRTDELWGFCGTCYYADVCTGGCTWTSHSLLGRPGNNPYCHYRASELQKQGIRERVIAMLPAPGMSFDHGRFTIVTEPDPASQAGRDGDGGDVCRRSAERPDVDERRTPMELCRACNSYVYGGTVECPHCGGHLAASDAAHRQVVAEANRAAAVLNDFLRDAGAPGL